VLAASLLALGGCGGLGHVQVFTVSMFNDTGNEVVIRNCDNFCSSSLIVFDLQPGESAEVHRTTNQHKEFSVTTASGGHVGCLDLFFKTAQPGAQVPVSAATRCPSGSGVPWKAIALVVAVLALLALVIVGRS